VSDLACMRDKKGRCRTAAIGAPTPVGTVTGDGTGDGGA
jgi:hypothetical protein